MSGIKEIADALGVSIGTVDRALHDRPGVNPMTKKRVLQMARTVGYKPNQAARFLASRKAIRIGVNLPAEVAQFFNAVREGIEDAAASPQGAGVEVEYRTFPRLGVGEVEAFEEALASGVNGLVICPGAPSELKHLIRRASRLNVPVVCVATDAPGTERLAVVSADPGISGAMAAELLGWLLQGEGETAVVSGSMATADHVQKRDAFAASQRELFPDMRVSATIEAHDNFDEAYQKSRELLQEHPELRGVYIGTANSIPVLQAIDDAGLSGTVAVIATDLFPELAQRIRSGSVAATIHQRPRTQGLRAFQELHRFLRDGACPSAQVRLAPHVVMRSNLAFFLKQISDGVEEDVDASIARPPAPRKIKRAPRRVSRERK